jgi:putative ABC transport system permease protein
MALLFALILTKILLPAFNTFTQRQLKLGFETDYRIWLGIVLTILLVALLSGLYPALFQSRLKPLLLLKNKIQVGKGNISLRRSLVVFSIHAFYHYDGGYNSCLPANAIHRHQRHGF